MWFSNLSKKCKCFRNAWCWVILVELQHAVIIVNFLYGPIELGLNLHIYLLQNQNINDADANDIYAWHHLKPVICNTAIVTMNYDHEMSMMMVGTTTINKSTNTGMMMMLVVIQLNLFILCVSSENPYFTVKVHSRRSQSHFPTTTPHISIRQLGANICQQIICQLEMNICQKGWCTVQYNQYKINSEDFTSLHFVLLFWVLEWEGVFFLLSEYWNEKARFQNFPGNKTNFESIISPLSGFAKQTQKAATFLLLRRKCN